jgi:hypothetical protein
VNSYPPTQTEWSTSDCTVTSYLYILFRISFCYARFVTDVTWLFFNVSIIDCASPVTYSTLYPKTYRQNTLFDQISVVIVWVDVWLTFLIMISLHTYCNKTIFCVFLAFCMVKVKVPRNRPEGLDGGRGIALSFVDLGTRREWVVSTTPRPLYPRERPGTHCTGGWVDPSAGLDVGEKFRPHRDSIPGPSSP